MDRIQKTWNRPTPAPRPPPPDLSHLLRCKGRWRAPRGAHGEERAVGTALPALLPAALRVTAAKGPHLTSSSGVGIPQPVETLAPGAHAEVGPVLETAEALRPCSQASRPGAGGPELRGMKTRARGGLLPRPGHSPRRLASLQQWPGHPPVSRKIPEYSKRPRELDPPSAGGTWARGTARRGRAYKFVQRRLHLAASLISGCGLR